MTDDEKTTEILELYKNAKPLYYSIINGFFKCREDQEDILQDAFTNAFRFRARFVNGGKKELKSWTCKIVMNTCINAWRLSLRRPQYTDLPDNNEFSFIDGEIESLLNDGLSDNLEAAFGNVDDRFVVPMLLHIVGEKTYKEIAETLGIKVGTVGTRIMRGKEKIQKCIKRIQK